MKQLQTNRTIHRFIEVKYKKKNCEFLIDFHIETQIFDNLFTLNWKILT